VAVAVDLVGFEGYVMCVPATRQLNGGTSSCIVGVGMPVVVSGNTSNNMLVAPVKRQGQTRYTQVQVCMPLITAGFSVVSMNVGMEIKMA